MPQTRKQPPRFASRLILLLVLAGPCAWAAAPVGEVTHVSGALVVKRAGGVSKILAPRSQVESGDLLATAGDTYARVKFSDGGEVTLRPNTQFMIEQFNYVKDTPAQDNAIFRLLKGGFRTLTGVVGKRKPDSYQMRTAVATIGIRGTVYGAQYCENDCLNLRNSAGQTPGNGLHLDVGEGGVNVTNAGGTKPLSAGEFGYVADNAKPMDKVPASQGVTNNTPGFGAGPASGAQTECVVQ
ncbi:MAG: FecR domain-containing protein [Burkholderiales bacterium]